MSNDIALSRSLQEMPELNTTPQDVEAAKARSPYLFEGTAVNAEMVLAGFLETRTRQLREAQALISDLRSQVERAENKHVRFMVAGGPVVMATEYDAMRDRAEKAEQALSTAQEDAIRKALEACISAKEGLYPHDEGVHHSELAIRALLLSSESAKETK